MELNTIDYRITFFVKDQGLPPQVASQLTRLAKKFKSLVYIDNITQNRSTNAESSLGLLQVGLCPGDFCQLITVGMDAEWANFVLTDLLSSTFDFVASDKLCDFSETITNTYPQLTPQCEVDFHYVKAQAVLSKFEILKGLSQLIYPKESDELLLALIKREERSSTVMAKQIALPHVISPYVEKPTIAIIRSDYPVDWASKMGDVNVIIALVLPEKPTKEMIMAATYLTRSLLSEDFSQRLVHTRQPKGLQALILYAMCQLL
ncbi:PTS sugar transporter subunit IIA [Aliivibrio fischeri]|uniref:PTS sugar transporter subunit IIA n=1 Tax=Aliivibrio fischeri TaxID=668 RepID=UPI001F414F6D|nr:PTS sugar transporter subunit IIA [Aliivibrio fischeri]MCE7535678.1 PTS sugar transporter subunit IIA [Aliivibrio fischeri]MCE7558746.1 PTS sugar transporter subunit IIA [Aliivibrio fischeri]